MRLVVIFILSLVIGVSLSAQISVSSGFSKDTVQLGEEVNYTVTVKVDPKVSILNVDLIALDSIISLVQTQIKAQTDTTGNPGPAVGDYTISSYGRWNDISENKKIDITELSWDTTMFGNQLLLENTFKISFWDAGPNILRTPNVVYELGGISSEFISNTGAQIFVDVPFEEQELSDSIDIAPIKPIIVEEKDITDFYPLFYFLGFLLMLPIVYFIYKKITSKPLEEVKEIEVYIPAHQIALDKLGSLRESKLWQKGEVKAYQSELTHIIREYLENRYDIQALESSTDEIVKALKESNFDSSDESDLKTILQVADLVKFAKAKPSEEIHEEFLNTAFSFVKKTKGEDIEPMSSMPIQDGIEEPPKEIISNNSSQLSKQLIANEVILANFWRRALAHLIDINLFTLFLAGFYLVSFMVLGLKAGEFTIPILILVVFSFIACSILYYAYPQYKFRQTVGKKIAKIEVVTTQHENISFVKSVIRILVRMISHAFFLLPYVTFFFTKNKQTVHDLIAKTVVIKKHDSKNLQEFIDINNA